MAVFDVSNTVWRKSSRSGAGNDCVEIAHGDAAVAVRDSKNPHGHMLVMSPHEWATFLRVAATLKR